MMSQSYGTDNYTAYACYDFSSQFANQSLIASGTYESASSSNPNNIVITPNSSTVSFAFKSSVYPNQAGALLSFGSSTVTARFGISLISTDQACANAEEEVPTWNWDAVQTASVSKWEDVLSRVQVDTDIEDPTVVELLYSSVSLVQDGGLFTYSRTRISYTGHPLFLRISPMRIRIGILRILSTTLYSGV